MDEFQVLIHREGSSMHLKLVGELDNDAALKVIDVLTRHYSILSKIFIHTNTIDRILDFDSETFKSRIREINSRSIPIFFTGEYGTALASQGINIFHLK